MARTVSIDLEPGVPVAEKVRELAQLSEREHAALRLTDMGFIFQQIHLLANLTILDNVLLSGYLARRTHRKSVDRRAAELLELIARIHEAGTTVMVVTHDIKVASRSERVLFMLDGRIAGEKHLGPPTGNGSAARAREEELTAWLIELGL